MATADSEGGAVEPRGRRCPMCGGELEDGTVSVHGTPLGFLFVGASHQHCWFKGLDGEEEVVIRSGDGTEGVRCRGCGFVGIRRRA